jgi:hypothetical protein
VAGFITGVVSGDGRLALDGGRWRSYRERWLAGPVCVGLISLWFWKLGGRGGMCACRRPVVGGAPARRGISRPCRAGESDDGELIIGSDRAGRVSALES